MRALLFASFFAVSAAKSQHWIKKYAEHKCDCGEACCPGGSVLDIPNKLYESFAQLGLSRVFLTMVAVYAVVELVCYVHYLKRVAVMASYRTPLSLNFDHNRWSQFFSERVLRERARSPRALLAWVSSCFWDIPIHRLYRDNVKAMLLMMSTCREAHDGPYFQGERALAEELVGVVDGAMAAEGLGKLKEGADETSWIRVNNPCTNSGAQTPFYKPMLVEFVFWAVRVWTNRYLAQLGFRRTVCNETGFVYWLRRSDPYIQPGVGRALVFIHGIGIGVLPYLSLITRLSLALRHTHTTVILAEIPMISGFPARDYGGVGSSAKMSTLRPPFPRPDEIAASMASFIKQSGHSKADFVGHSYGTVITTYVSNHQPSAVGKVAFLDPICFFPHNTIFWPYSYKPISGWSILSEFCRGQVTQALQHCVHALVFGDVCQNHVIRNCTWLMEQCNREHLLGADTLLVMGGNDPLVAAQELTAYMASYHPSVTCVLIAGWEHGTVRKEVDKSLSILCPFLKEPESQHKPESQQMVQDAPSSLLIDENGSGKRVRMKKRMVRGWNKASRWFRGSACE